jgi:hypothetical protein
MRIGRFNFTREKPGVISEGPCWVCTYDGYLHVCDTLPQLVWELFTQFRSDKHLVG